MTDIPALPKSIAAAISAIMNTVPKLGRGEENEHGNYKFASIDDFLEAVRPLCAENGLIILQDEESFAAENGWLTMTFAFGLAHSSGEMWGYRPRRTIMVSSKMGAQAFGAAQSYALKQYLRSLFQIATGDKEDADSHPQSELPKRAQRTQKRMDADIPKDQPPIQPQDVGPPTDENGEVLPPHMIVVPTTKDQKGEPQPDWLTWGQIWSAAIRSAETTAEVDKWLEANAAQLDNLATANERFWKRALDLADGRKSVLLGAAA